MASKLTDQDIETAIALYNIGKSQREIAQQFNCSQTNISNILKKRNIKTRVGKNIIYKDINTNFFKNIDNEFNAYFLGLLYADGCVQIKNSSYMVTIKLQIADKVILEKFRDIMSPSSVIKIVDGKYCYFRINQKEICEQLIVHGCVPNKSLILKFPTTVPKQLLKHFIRGYSDGDGSIYKNKLKHTTNTIWKIVSTADFCNQVNYILKNTLNINTSRSLCNNNITTTLSVGGNTQVKKLLDWIYQDATVYLPRKYNKYLEFIKNKGD